MTIPLRVLGDRVLVKPDVASNAPEQRESGVYVAKSLAAAVTGEDPTQSLHRGTVIAVGTPRHPLHHEAEYLAEKLWPAGVGYSTDPDVGSSLEWDAAHMLRDLVRKQPAVAVGDDVLFSHDAGQELTLESDTYVILHESELIAVIEPEQTEGIRIETSGASYNQVFNNVIYSGKA